MLEPQKMHAEEVVETSLLEPLTSYRILAASMHSKNAQSKDVSRWKKRKEHIFPFSQFLEVSLSQHYRNPFMRQTVSGKDYQGKLKIGTLLLTAEVILPH